MHLPIKYTLHQQMDEIGRKETINYIQSIVVKLSFSSALSNTITSFLPIFKLYLFIKNTFD